MTLYMTDAPLPMRDRPVQAESERAAQSEHLHAYSREKIAETARIYAKLLRAPNDTSGKLTIDMNEEELREQIEEMLLEIRAVERRCSRAPTREAAKRLLRRSKALPRLQKRN